MTRSCYTIAIYKGKGEGTPMAEKILQTVFDRFPWTNIMNRDRNETIQEIRDDNSNIFFCKCCVGGVMMPATPGSGGAGEGKWGASRPKGNLILRGSFQRTVLQQEFPRRPFHLQIRSPQGSGFWNSILNGTCKAENENIYYTCLFTNDVCICKLLFYIFIVPRQPPKDEEGKRETGELKIVR